MVSKDESAGTTSPPTATSTDSAAPVAAATTGSSSSKKKFMGLGSYLPKVPSYLLQKNDKGHAGEDPADELKDLPEVPDRHSHDAQPAMATTQQQPSAAAAAAAALRRRGMSIEANVSTLYRRMTIRQSSSSIPADSSPSERSSLTGSSSGAHSPRSDPALKARRGACVATKFGTGVVLDVRLDDGFYIVQLVPKSVAYLREDAIVREIKSVVGERVKTRWGLATVEQYYVEDDMYSIALDWRWDDEHVWRMKATTKKFEKIAPRGSIMQNTRNMLFEGYSSIRDSTSTGYANVVARLNTPAAPKKPAAAQSPGKALTPFGVCTVLEVRADKVFVVKTPSGATAFVHADSVKLQQQRRTHFTAGDRVKTPFGLGEVLSFRDADEMYEVKLELTAPSPALAPTLYISDVNAETQLTFASSSGAPNNRLSSILTLTRNSVFSAGATVKASATGGLTTLSTVKAKVSTMAAVKLAKQKFQKGERVVTLMGSGFVVDARPLEKIYEVFLRRLKFTGYFHEASLTPFPYERVTHFVVDGRTIPAPEMPRNVSEVKRRQVITAAIQSAREGKFLQVPGSAPAAAVHAPAKVAAPAAL
ncbi:hypothetical protein PybrP1_012119 [[Pythium] brassicae (nom. inval.)]|nr:hypothetical protein PybrP1_012119 [[Pythium] brassicae (nom. inval.)]